MSLAVVPLTLAQANALVAMLHRHHKPVVSHRFSIGCVDDRGELHGAAIVGRPVARMTDTYRTAEVTRLVTDGTRNACSILYAAAARACEAMGYDRVQTFILESEPGTSVRAAGWTCDAASGGGDWNRPSQSYARRTDQPMEGKQRWAKVFRITPILLPKHSIANASDRIAIAHRKEIISDSALYGQPELI